MSVSPTVSPRAPSGQRGAHFFFQLDESTIGDYCGGLRESCLRMYSQREPTLTTRPANQAPPLATVPLASSLRSLRRSDAPHCNRVIAAASLEGALVARISSDSAPHEEQETAGERGAHFPGHTSYGGTAVSSVSPHDECLEQTTPPPHSVGGYADRDRWPSSVSDESRRQDAPRQAVGEQGTASLGILTPNNSLQLTPEVHLWFEGRPVAVGASRW